MLSLTHHCSFLHILLLDPDPNPKMEMEMGIDAVWKRRKLRSALRSNYAETCRHAARLMTVFWKHGKRLVVPCHHRSPASLTCLGRCVSNYPKKPLPDE
jgi:hypothetical protein